MNNTEREPMEHELKCDAGPFRDVAEGIKKSEVRRDDRDFRVDDTLLMVETRFTGAEMRDGKPLEYTGRFLRRCITHIQRDYGLPDGLAVLSFDLPQHVEQVRDLELDMYRTFYGTLAPTAAVIDVLAERRRQVSTEGWKPEHDDQYVAGELAAAAVCYAGADTVNYPPGECPDMWPWAPEWWKPRDDRRNLVRATALLLAEIERIDRAAMRCSKDA